MPLASEVAAELRRLADSLDKEPETAIKAPWVFFSHYSESDKAAFFSLARLIPRPFKKVESITKSRVELEYTTPAISFTASIPKSITCRLVTSAQEAVYECEPLLSAEEDAALEVSA